MPIVLLLRHGEIPQTNPRRFVGQRDLPLTELGRSQANYWREALQNVPLAGVYCSSLRRCTETADIILGQGGPGAHPLAAQPLDSLREINLGQWQGLSVAEVKGRFPDEYERRGADLANTVPAGGESFAQAQERAWNGLRGILTHSSGPLLVVGHAGINRALICQAIGLPLERLFSLGQEYAALNILAFPQNSQPQLLALNLPPQPLSDRLQALGPGLRRA